jgi:glutamate 5-kinase
VRRAISGEEVGTWVGPRGKGLSARRLWIAFGVPASGRITVDGGAFAALLHGNRSLLAVGVHSVEGNFTPGEAVEIYAPDGDLIGKGISRSGAAGLRKALGKRSDEHAEAGVVIHRDDLVVLVEPGS